MPGVVEGLWLGEHYQKVNGADCLVERTPLMRNAFVFNYATASAALFSNRPEWIGKGILWHAFGSGDGLWDTKLPVVPRFTEKLTAETIRVPPMVSEFVKYAKGEAYADGTSTRIIDPYRFAGCDILGRFEVDGFFVGAPITVLFSDNPAAVGYTGTVTNYTRTGGLIDVAPALGSGVFSAGTVYEIGPVISVNATNAIRVKTIFDYGNASDPWNNLYYREHGLFAGPATETADSGWLINCLRHKAMAKNERVRTIWYVTLAFRI